MEQFFNFIKNIGLNFTFVLDPVKKIEGVTPFAYYKRGTAMILPKTLQPGKNTLYASIAFPETDTDSGGRYEFDCGHEQFDDFSANV